MEYQRLGASGLEVSPICLGTMMFGDRTDAATSQRIIDAAFDAGINFIDTADAYGNGASEKIVGAAIKANRRRWILATKVGNPLTKKPHDGGLSRRWVLQACDDSLARLATDYIDIYYLHKDDPHTPIAETVGAVGDLIRSGKIRYFGVSNYRGWRIAEVVSECEAQGVPLPVVCQPYYNLLNRMPEVEILPACDHYGIGVAPYSPIARGVLTGKYRPGVAPEGSRVARKDARMMETEFREESIAIAQKLDGARQENRPHADAVRARVAVGERDRDLGDRRSAHARAVAGLRRRARHEVERGRRGARRFAGDARASVDARLQRSAVSVLRANRRRLSVCSATRQGPRAGLG